MKSFDVIKATLREAQVLAALLKAAGVAPLALAGACADRPVGASDGQVSGIGTTTASDETTASPGTATESSPGTVTETAPGTATETEPDTATATGPGTATATTGEMTGPGTDVTTAWSDSDRPPDCPINYLETVECVDLPGDTSTGDNTDGDSTTDGGTSTTTGDSTGGTTTGTTGGSGPCEGVEVPLHDDCGLYAYDVSPVYELRGQCCVNVTWEETCCGRPFLVEETARTAHPIARADWSSPAAPALAGLSARERAALAAEWVEDGLAEHASVAAFARFALQLLALGAPAALVEAAQQAMADEIAHARLCFGLAAAYGGEPRGPSPLPLTGALAGADDLVAVTVATLREGCIGETIAALQAEAALGRAKDPAVRAALAQIAADELRHAELAWRFVAWALERGGAEVHAACAAALAAAEANVGRTFGQVEQDMSPRMLAHGRLGAAGRVAVARRAMAAVVGPAGRALLARHAGAAAA
ncbi:ferritin-like domain-containing protein [Nannocystis exedens]|nr:ferritin-like domain-containing protein [Nannocystis exedens]